MSAAVANGAAGDGSPDTLHAVTPPGTVAGGYQTSLPSVSRGDNSFGPDPPCQGPMQLMEALSARYGTLNTIELARFPELLATHLRAIRPEFISFSFRSGVKRQHKLALGRIRQPVVAERQLQ